MKTIKAARRENFMTWADWRNDELCVAACIDVVDVLWWMCDVADRSP
ncbi:hypothetical protein AB4076_11910 [Dyella sp. 2RAF44]